MSASPPPLKRARLSLGTSHFSPDDGLRERAVASLARPVTFAPAIDRIGTTAAFGGVRCAGCVEDMAKVIADRADPIVATPKSSICFLCFKPGHWASACPLHWCNTCTACVEQSSQSDFVGRQLRKTGRIVRGILDDAQSHTLDEQGGCPSLLELSARAVASLPLEKLNIEIQPHIAAAEIVPRLPFHLIDRFYYEQPPQLSGAVTTETHAVAMRRFHACIVHILYTNTIGRSSEDVDIPLWDVFGESKLLFAERLSHRGVFEESGEFLFADAPPRRVVANAETAMTNFDRLSRGLIGQDVLEPDRVVVAGGSVLGALVLDPDTTVENSPFKCSDIDLFILGSENTGSVGIECLAHTTLARVVGNYKKMYPEGEYAIICRKEISGSVVSTGCVATCFFEGEGLPTVQVIMRNGIRSPEELLATFDVDCCGFALAQGRFVASSHAARALAHGYNIFNPTFAQRDTTIPRLRKYAQRGFPVFVPMKAKELLASTDLATLRSKLLDSTYDDELLLKLLCSPYMGGGVDVFDGPRYAPFKIPDDCTTVRALETALDGEEHVAIARSIDNCEYGRECDGNEHILCDTGWMAQDAAEVCHMPHGGFPEHPLLAPIAFPCSLEIVKKMVRLKRYSDGWRRVSGPSSSSSAGMVQLGIDSFLNPRRPAKRVR
jgi:hypothetical protein